MNSVSSISMVPAQRRILKCLLNDWRGYELAIIEIGIVPCSFIVCYRCNRTLSYCLVDLIFISYLKGNQESNYFCFQNKDDKAEKNYMTCFRSHD